MGKHSPRAKRDPARVRRGVVTRLRRPHESALIRYARTTLRETYFLHFVLALVVLWASFAAALYLVERSTDEPVIETFGEALYWGIAAFSTAGIADMPKSSLSQLIGGLWIIIGSVIFFGIIVASVTGYFMRPAQHPLRRLIDMIEYNLEHIQDLTVEELDLLKETTDALIQHVERRKEEHARQADNPGRTDEN
jgi:voltage-gated potassium channel